MNATPRAMEPNARRGDSVGRGWRLFHGEVDGVLLSTVIALLVIGLLVMFSASYPAAIEDGKKGTYYASRQMAFAIIGVVVMGIASVVNYHIYERLSVSGTAFIIALLLLVAVLIPGVGLNRGGATRWIGGEGFQFQPSELMKIAIVLLFATLIVRNAERMQSIRYGILPYLGVLVVVGALMMLEPHLSGTIIIVVLALTLMFVGGAKPLHLAVMTLIGAIALVLGVLLMIHMKGMDYFQVRILSWLDPFNEAYMQDQTWQTCQSLIAIGSGGMFGLGLGASRQKYNYLPEAQNDFVFAILCEEFGFVGAVTVILLFCLLVFRGFYIAAKAKDRFGMLVAVGLTMHIGLQALLNIAVVSNAIPNTGISLPFFSYGGTALVMQLAEMGILLNISRQAKLE